MEYHFTMCDETNSFESRYHMSVEAYKTLAAILSPDFTLDINQSSCRINTEYISMEVIVYVGTCYIGGEYIKSLADICAMSISSVKRLVNLFLNQLILQEIISCLLIYYQVLQWIELK